MYNGSSPFKMESFPAKMENAIASTLYDVAKSAAQMMEIVIEYLVIEQRSQLLAIETLPAWLLLITHHSSLIT
jgi:hypothetical protein